MAKATALEDTPLIKQFFATKALYPEAVLLYRVGDFYETYSDDAILASKVLGIVLTKRSNGDKGNLPMAGFPHHAMDVYLPKLVRAGYKVAVCDQLEDPKLVAGKKLVKRGVTELVTPGVAVSDEMLSQKEHNYLAGLSFEKETNDKLKKEIQKVLNKYIDSNNLSDVQISLTDEEYEEFVSVYNHITTTYRLEFERLSDDYRKNKQVLERNSRKLSNIHGNENDELIKNIRAQKNKIEDEIVGVDNTIKSLHETMGTYIQELATTNKQISEISKLVSLDDTDEKKDSLSKQLIEELSDFLYQLKIEKKYSLERRIKSILNTLMHKADFIGHVEVVVSDDDMDIDLYSVDGRKIHKDTLSKGEQQLYATSILKALVEESGIQFPVFIDSPLQKFDKSHATKIITEFYPSISKQVVLFPLLHKELTTDEFEIMKDSVNETFIISNDTTHSYFEKVPINKFMTY